MMICLRAKNKDNLGNPDPWRKHLRSWGKRVFWKRHRQRAKAALHRRTVDGTE